MESTKLVLEQVATIAIPAIDTFIAAEHFVIDTSEEARVKIAYIGYNFKKHFLQKVEKSEVVAEELVINKFLKFAYDPVIITALGGEEKVEITLGQYFAAFAKQPKGENGLLLTNGLSNVAYVRDFCGVLWAVYGYWIGDGWYFEALPICYPSMFIHNRQFLSH